MFKSSDSIASVVGIFMFLTISKFKQVLRSRKGLDYNTGFDSFWLPSTLHLHVHYVSGVWFDKSKQWVAGLGLSPFGLEDKFPEPPGCLILEDLQTLHIPPNKKLEVWTQYRP